jgi:nitrite reductase/ring-hydroxylating ferredoxin subunit
MPEFVKVARLGEIAPGQAKLIEAAGKEIALFNVAGAFHAIDNNCTHVGGPLCEGELDGIEVTCPWHGAAFDVTTGATLGPPAGAPVSRYNVRVEGSDIEVEISYYSSNTPHRLEAGYCPPFPINKIQTGGQ